MWIYLSLAKQKSHRNCWGLQAQSCGRFLVPPHPFAWCGLDLLVLRLAQKKKRPNRANQVEPCGSNSNPGAEFHLVLPNMSEKSRQLPSRRATNQPQLRSEVIPASFLQRLRESSMSSKPAADELPVPICSKSQIVPIPSEHPIQSNHSNRF